MGGEQILNGANNLNSLDAFIQGMPAMISMQPSAAWEFLFLDPLSQGDRCLTVI